MYVRKCVSDYLLSITVACRSLLNRFEFPYKKCACLFDAHHSNGFGEKSQGLIAAFATQTAGAHSANRNAKVAHHPRINPHRAAIKLRGYAAGARGGNGGPIVSAAGGGRRRDARRDSATAARRGECGAEKDR